MTLVRFVLAIFTIVVLGVCGGDTDLHAATCVGADPCRACTSCSSCKRCAKDGGTCGVCKKSKR